MSLINVQNLTFTHDGGFEPVFEDVGFRLDTDWKTGLIGRNGRGKTTFLQLLLGKYEYRGTISASVKFTYFPFEVTNKSRLTYEVLGDVCPAEDWEIMRELNLLEVDAAALYRPFDTLSDGERTKILLGALFLCDNNFLLIDEPTNHLDEDARAAVAAYLRKKRGFIVVSHDRAFLDGCVDHILSINRSDITVQAGNFSTWYEEFTRRQASEEEQNARLRKDISRLNEAARRTAAWADKTEKEKFGVGASGLKADKGYVGHKAAKLMKHAKVTEKRMETAAAQKSELLKNTETAPELKLFPLEHHSNRLFAATELCIFYDGRKACGPMTFELCRGERLALHGKNGCGKSSILKLITGEQTAATYTGSFTLASGLVVSYVPQNAAHLTGSLADYARDKQIDESLFKTILRKTGFDRADFDRDMFDFSAGQKKKVLIAVSLCERAHLYVWDEPLNYIDIYSRMQIENLIASFSPTMIFVEHDKTFRETIATKTVLL